MFTNDHLKRFIRTLATLEDIERLKNKNLVFEIFSLKCKTFGFCKKLEAIFILRFRSVLCSVHCPKNKLNKNRACHADLSVYCWFMFQATQARDISSSRDKLCWYAGSDYFWDSMTFYTLSQRESIFRDICIIRNVAGKTRYYAEYIVNSTGIQFSSTFCTMYVSAIFSDNYNNKQKAFGLGGTHFYFKLQQNIYLTWGPVLTAGSHW